MNENIFFGWQRYSGINILAFLQITNIFFLLYEHYFIVLTLRNPSRVESSKIKPISKNRSLATHAKL